MVSVVMTSSEAAVLTAWAKQAPGEAYKPDVHTHIPSRFSRSCSPLRSLTVQAPRFLFLHCGESAAAERGGAGRRYRALRAQSYLYSVYRFTLTHHGAGRSTKSAAAYHWRKKMLHFLNKKLINHLHIKAGCETETLVFVY